MSKTPCQADLDRLGITPEQWSAHQARFDAEIPFEVRVIGGGSVLREALRAAGAEYEIVHRHPVSWSTYADIAARGLMETFELPGK